MAVKVYFKRTLSLIILVCFLTLVVFVSLNRPKEVKAAVIPAVALGVGALAVLVASYFSTAGIQLSQSGGEGTTYFEDFINDTVQQFKEDDAQSQAIFDQYFDSEGRYIGSEEDLQFILSPQARGYWSMGKDLVSGLESLKSWFVSENSLTSDTTVVLDSDSFFMDDNGVIVRSYPSNTFVGNVILSNGIFSMPLTTGDQFVFSKDNDSIGITLDASGHCVAYSYVNGVLDSSTSGNTWRGDATNQNIYLVNNYNSNGQLYYYFSWASTLGGGGLGTSLGFNIDLTSFFSDTLNNISLDGTLTDGYEDFEEALNQDLANESENDDAVVVTGVGELGTDLTYDQIKELILQNVITGELNPTYEGTYENQEAAEEDLDKESPIVTPDWRPTPVIVNGLEDFFPFCIPFDLYAVIELLNTEAVAPKFTGHLDFAGIFEAQNIELDFSQFEYLARIVRTIIVIAFLIFIILKTRDMIRG